MDGLPFWSDLALETNVMGTFHLLTTVRESGKSISEHGGGSFPARSTDRGVRVAGAGRPAVYRDHPVRPQQPLLCVEGGLRSFRAGLPPHLRAAHVHHQLLQQLRACRLPRKSFIPLMILDPGRRTLHLWGRRQCPGLAFCQRPLRGPAPGPGKGPGGGYL